MLCIAKLKRTTYTITNTHIIHARILPFCWWCYISNIQICRKIKGHFHSPATCDYCYYHCYLYHLLACQKPKHITSHWQQICFWSFPREQVSQNEKKKENGIWRGQKESWNEIESMRRILAKTSQMLRHWPLHVKAQTMEKFRNTNKSNSY